MAAIDIDDRDARSDQERQESRIMLDALRARREAIGGVAAVPDDEKLTARILDEARKRSAEISGSKAASARAPVSSGQGVSWWQIVAWVATIATVALAFWWLHWRHG